MQSGFLSCVGVLGLQFTASGEVLLRLAHADTEIAITITDAKKNIFFTISSSICLAMI